VNRIALIGCGAIAAGGHAPVIRRHPRFALAAVCDVKPEAARRLAREFGDAPAYEDWRDLLDREEFDAAVLALPPEVSPDVVIECLRRGLPVLDEKPLAATPRDGRRVERALAEFGGVYQCGFVLRYADWVREVGRLAAAIGAPSRTRVTVYDERLDRSDVEHLNRIQSFLANSSAMTHEGSHVVDYAAIWNPSPWTRVRASAERTAPDFKGPNVWRASVESADGSTLDMEIGWLLPALPPCAVSIEGPGGRLELNPSTGIGGWRIGAERGTLALPPLAPEWDRQYDAFAEAIDRGVAATATLADGLRALEVTAAAEASARNGAAVERIKAPQGTKVS